MSIHNKNTSNREPRRSRKHDYKFYTTRDCPTCGRVIISPENQLWDCVWCERNEKREIDPRLTRRAAILATLKEEPLTKAEALPLIEELAEIDQALQFNPSDSLNDFIGATWKRMEEISF